MIKPSIGLSAKNLKGITAVLSSVLADSVILYLKTRKFHWNVSGESFMELHKLFEKQYTQLEEAIDEIAERINKLGYPTIGTTSEFASLSTIKENPGKNPNAIGMIKELLGDHEGIVTRLREHIDHCEDEFEDKVTADFLTNLAAGHETMAWMLRRYIG